MTEPCGTPTALFSSKFLLLPVQYGGIFYDLVFGLEGLQVMTGLSLVSFCVDSL